MYAILKTRCGCSRRIELQHTKPSISFPLVNYFETYRAAKLSDIVCTNINERREFVRAGKQIINGIPYRVYLEKK